MPVEVGKTGLVNVMRTCAAPVVALAILAAMLTFISLPASADASFSISAASTPSEVTVDHQVAISINVSNTGSAGYQKLVLQVFIYPDAQIGLPQPDQVLNNLGAGRTATINYTYTPRTADFYSMTVKVYNQTTNSSNFLFQQDLPSVFQAKSTTTTSGGGFPLELLAVIVVALVVVAVVTAVVVMRRNKAARAAAEEAAKAAARTYREPEEARIQGKFPKDYYKFRREKLSRLKPVGLTRSGHTILGNSGHKEVETQETRAEAAAEKNVCDRCGLEMGHDWKTCKNCGATGTIEKAEETLKKLEAAGGNVANLRDLLASAEAERASGNYDEAETYGHDVLDRGRSQLKKREEAQKQAEGPGMEATVSYAPEQLAEKEAEPHAEKGYSHEEQAAKGYADTEVKAKGYQEPSASREYSEAADTEKAGQAPMTGAEKAAPAPVAGATAPDDIKPRKGEKKDGVPCYKCGQSLKPEWKKCPYCDAFQEGICPGCGRTIKMKWNVCPQCRTDLVEQPPKPACPVCGAEMAQGEECHSCKARSLMDITSRLVREVKAKGADVVEAEALIGRGELALKIKNYDKAVAHFQKAEELAKKSRKEFRIRRLNEKIEHARGLVKDSADLGADVGEARAMIEKASAALSEERFEEGLGLADRAAQLAEEALDKAVEGKEMEQKENAKIPVSVRKPVIIGQVKVKPRCPHCQEFVDETWPVCPYCQTPLVWKCPKCGSDVKPEWKACPACESPLRWS